MSPLVVLEGKGDRVAGRVLATRAGEAALLAPWVHVFCLGITGTQDAGVRSPSQSKRNAMTKFQLRIVGSPSLSAEHILEPNRPRLHGIYAPDDAHLAFGNHCVKQLAPLSNFLDHMLHVLLGNPLNELVA